MRAIIIDDADCQALVDRLKLESMQIEPEKVVTLGSGERVTVGDIHRQFHYEVVRWLQQHGWRSHG